MEAAPDGRLLADAERAVTMAPAHPHRAATLARDVLTRARDAGHHEARAVAERALGLAARDGGDVDAAVRHLRAGAAIARRHGLRAREGEARTSLVFVLLSAGRTAAALREAGRAAPLLERLDAARLGAQRALAEQRLGRTRAAELGLRQAMATFRRLHSPVDEARVAGNLGVIAAYGGDLAGADRLLHRALELFDQLGLDLAATDATHNLGWVAARGGDIPRALDRYDEAQRRAAELGIERSVYLLDRCEALLAVRLNDEALDLAERAATALSAAGMRAEHAEALLLAAQAALLTGWVDLAQQRASDAKRAFTRQQRAPWAALAGYVELQARTAGATAADGRASTAGATGATGAATEGASHGVRAPSARQAWALAAALDGYGWAAPAAGCA